MRSKGKWFVFLFSLVFVCAALVWIGWRSWRAVGCFKVLKSFENVGRPAFSYPSSRLFGRNGISFLSAKGLHFLIQDPHGVYLSTESQLLTSELILSMEQLPRLSSLYFRYPDSKVEHFAAISELESLRNLILWDMSLGQDAIQALSKIPLQSIALKKMNLDGSVNLLENFPEISHFVLRNTRLPIEDFVSGSQIRELGIHSAIYTDRELLQISNSLPRLESLYLMGAGIEKKTILTLRDRGYHVFEDRQLIVFGR